MSIQQWQYSQPVNIIFGNHKVESLHDIFEELHLKNGILVSDPALVKNGLTKKILKYSKGRLIEIFSDITANPTIANVNNCANVIRKNNIEFVVALGGGSALDCAKAAASACLTEYSITDFLSGRRRLGTEHLPLIAIPTTSGTGSEVTPVSVLSDPSTKIKHPMSSKNFYPNYAIIDPVLTLTVPSYVTAYTGMDALAHALEAFWSKNHQPICDALALHSARIIFNFLLEAYDNGTNLKARTKMSEASVIAGLAFGLPKTAASHACSYPLTSIYNMPHGEACAFTLDVFTRINASAEEGRLNSFAKQLGFKDANDMADEILSMKKHMGLKITLKDAGIKLQDLDELSKSSQHPNMLNNPIEMDHGKILEMYKSLE